MSKEQKRCLERIPTGPILDNLNIRKNNDGNGLYNTLSFKNLEAYIETQKGSMGGKALFL